MRKACYSIARNARRSQIRRLATTAPAPPSVQITTLPNKIRVATETTPAYFSSVGLYVDAGSRYETDDILGSTHFLDRMAFKVRLACTLPFFLR